MGEALIRYNMVLVSDVLARVLKLLELTYQLIQLFISKDSHGLEVR